MSRASATTTCSSRIRTRALSRARDRATPRNGWFSYDLKVLPDKPMLLVCTYIGNEGRRRGFDILVDGEKDCHCRRSRSIPTELFDVEYKLPEQLTRGKQKSR